MTLTLISIEIRRKRFFADVCTNPEKFQPRRKPRLIAIGSLAWELPEHTVIRRVIIRRVIRSIIPLPGTQYTIHYLQQRKSSACANICHVTPQQIVHMLMIYSRTRHWIRIAVACICRWLPIQEKFHKVKPVKVPKNSVGHMLYVVWTPSLQIPN